MNIPPAPAPAPSPARRVILSRDGAEVAIFPDYWGAVAYLHRHTPYSADHATKYEGWRITITD